MAETSCPFREDREFVESSACRPFPTAFRLADRVVLCERPLSEIRQHPSDDKDFSFRFVGTTAEPHPDLVLVVTCRQCPIGVRHRHPGGIDPAHQT